MNDIPRLFQAFVAPAIFVSAEGLLLLSLNVRLMGIVSRLRAYLQNKHTAAKEGHIAKSEAYASQIASIERRAEMIRKAFMWTHIPCSELSPRACSLDWGFIGNALR
jgi:hypothetical protein